MASWLEQKIRRYEHMRWAQEPNRRLMPFAWGLEHIGGEANDSDPRGFLAQFADDTILHSDEWFSAKAAGDYTLEGDVLSFTSAIASPWRENNRVYGQLFRAKEGN